ncbi:hypothetical protein [Ferrimonas kyonanensis]|uniref:hypothetical protein n=1 Tax=Ferrimonas kyonanensis TaxID=364763 RepID=UPI000488EABA|nr:hypothetical protein [Ferrimonas kyonanensis]
MQQYQKVLFHRLPKPSHWALEVNGELVGAARFVWILKRICYLYCQRKNIRPRQIKAYRCTKAGARLINSDTPIKHVRVYPGAILLVGTSLASKPVLSDDISLYV